MLKNLRRLPEPVSKPLPVNEGHNMLTVIETTERPSTMKQLELHAVDLIDRNLPMLQVGLLIATAFFSMVMVAAIIVRALF